MGALDQKVCVITGAAGSLGAATARLFLAEGARLMLVDRRGEDLARLAAELGHDRDIATTTADVTIAADVARTVDVTVKRFGAIDVLFSNAGNFGTVAPIAAYPEDVFEAVYAVHVRGAFLLCKARRACDGQRRKHRHHVQCRRDAG